MFFSSGEKKGLRRGARRGERGEGFLGWIVFTLVSVKEKKEWERAKGV